MTYLLFLTPIVGTILLVAGALSLRRMIPLEHQSVPASRISDQVAEEIADEIVEMANNQSSPKKDGLIKSVAIDFPESAKFEHFLRSFREEAGKRHPLGGPFWSRNLMDEKVVNVLRRKGYKISYSQSLDVDNGKDWTGRITVELPHGNKRSTESKAAS